LEAASIPTASAKGLVTASLASPLDPAKPFADSFSNRLALGVAAGLLAVLVHGEAPRLATEELTWRALLGR
jgi:tetrahydromethanopterin S-methyltransferase subunit B